eukprot:SAG31_NODE_24394_length_482_cov_1.075718_1_plen_46_part_10
MSAFSAHSLASDQRSDCVCLTLSLADLDPSDETNACVWAIPGSHLG